MEEALAGYDEAVAAAPDDAEANSLYGLALTHMGRLDQAGPYLEKAVADEPDQIGFRLNLIEWLERIGAVDRGVEQVGAVLERDEGNLRALEKLGDLCMRAGKPGAASDAYHQAVTGAPDNYGLLLKLARAHAAFRNFADARDALDRAGQVGPRNDDYCEIMAFVLGAVGDAAALDALAREWIERAPNNPRAQRAAAQAAYESGRFRDALDAMEKAFGLGAKDAENLAAYGRIALDALEFDKARNALDEAEALAPNLAEMLAGKAQLLTFDGKFEEAETYCRRCLAVEPGFAAVYSILSRLPGRRLTEHDLPRLAELASNDRLLRDDRIAAAFALGRSLQDLDRIDDAFNCFAQANDLVRAHAAADGIGYTAKTAEDRRRKLQRLFAAPLKDAVSAHDQKPIFIVGMPRSGTTLIESVLSANEAVFACGERPDMQHLLNGYLNQVGEESPASGDVHEDWVKSYLQTMPSAGADHAWFTDKNPLNFECVGLIDRLFPDAPIIHIRRNPIETGFSIFANEFSRFWSFATSLEDIGHFYGQYAQLMAHWEAAYPNRIITIQYETFCSDFDSAAPALAETIGLDWTPGMATFQSAERPISTFSSAQAREPVAVKGKAGAYGDRLDPLRAALQNAGVDAETGEFGG